MSRYDELLAEMTKIAREQDNSSERVDPSHALQRTAHLEKMVAGLAWVLNQTINELAKRDA